MHNVYDDVVTFDTEGSVIYYLASGAIYSDIIFDHDNHTIESFKYYNTDKSIRLSYPENKCENGVISKEVASASCASL